MVQKLINENKEASMKSSKDEQKDTMMSYDDEIKFAKDEEFKYNLLDEDQVSINFNENSCEKTCSNSIERKSLMYKTEVEYGDYCINHVLGCAHGCKYPCYAFNSKKRFGVIKTYEEWKNPSIVSNSIEILKKELAKLKGNVKSVQLCFTTDPFMYQYVDIRDLSLEIIELLNNYNIKVTVLTKGILPSELADLSRDNEYGISLVSLN